MGFLGRGADTVAEATPLIRLLLLLMVVTSLQVARPLWALTPAEGLCGGICEKIDACC